MTDTYKITLKPVYSCPAAATPQGVKLPPGWSFMRSDSSGELRARARLHDSLEAIAQIERHAT